MIKTIVKIGSFLSLTALIGSGSLFGQMKEIEYEEYTLDNGLKVFLHEDHSTPIVAVTVMYHVGSKNENPDRTGFAHFFEHLLFEGSKNITERGQYSEYVEEAGGTLNANTSQDRTFYYEVLPSNQLELGLWLESERMMHAKVDEKGVETQREVVKEEKRQRVDNQPYGTVMEEAMKRAFKVHPYQWTPIGSMEHLDAAEEEDYVQFYKDFYVPHNAVLSIAGDIDIDSTKRLIEKYFATIPKGKSLNIYRDLLRLTPEEFASQYASTNNRNQANEMAKFISENEPMDVIKKYFKNETELTEIRRPEPNEPPLGGEIKDTIYDNIQLPAVMMGYRLPANGTDDFYAVSMMSDILSGGESSRLNRSLVQDKELSLFAASFPLPLEHPGISLMMSVANAGVELNKIEAAIDEEVEKIQNELVDEKEFQKIKNSKEADFISSTSTMARVAEELANYHVYYGDANLINTELEKYMEVTREDIQRVAKKYFTKDNRVVLYYLPKKEDGAQ